MTTTVGDVINKVDWTPSVFFLDSSLKAGNLTGLSQLYRCSSILNEKSYGLMSLIFNNIELLISEKYLSHVS